MLRACTRYRERIHPFATRAVCAVTLVLALSPAMAAQPPRPIAEFPEKPVLVQLTDGTLMAFFERMEPDGQTVTARTSPDLGRTWAEESRVMVLPREPGGWSLPEAFVDHEGEVHLFFLNDAHTGVILTGEDQRPKAGRLRDRSLDIWHARSRDMRARWEEPQKIWEGYTGALNSVIQTRTGRILLPFSCLTDRTWANRGEGLDAFTFRGQFDSTLVYSDDGGDTWTWPPVRLKTSTPDIVSAYGAVEPVVVELLDGRIWMLFRTQLGRFYESFSPDGAVWSTPMPSAIVSSDSPGGIVRLTDGRLMLFWNNCLRYPYAYGGRQVLHAAVSTDEGQTWRGYREVARDPLCNEPPPPRGDHGTAYPFPIALRDGRAAFVTGQGEGRVVCKVVDPGWLLETRQEEHFAGGLESWSIFGTKGVGPIPHPDRVDAQVLRIRREDANWPACAVWNFPAGAVGNIRLRLQLQPEARGLMVGITDHFSTPFDLEDIFYNLYDISLGPDLLLPGQWHDVELHWDCAERACEVNLDGKTHTRLRQTRDSTTPCYLRLRTMAESAPDSGVLVESVTADVAQPPE